MLRYPRSSRWQQLTTPAPAAGRSVNAIELAAGPVHHPNEGGAEIRFDPAGDGISRAMFGAIRFAHSPGIYAGIIVMAAS